MAQQITAIYENGVLRPLEPLLLADRQVVSLSIEPGASVPAKDRAEEPTLFELLDEVGLIGCVKDASADLSGNPQHLAGFGSSGA
jgi:predicted DNA-binding antitoxin AbrB/MazE fold protein